MEVLRLENILLGHAKACARQHRSQLNQLLGCHLRSKTVYALNVATRRIRSEQGGRPTQSNSYMCYSSKSGVERQRDVETSIERQIGGQRDKHRDSGRACSSRARLHERGRQSDRRRSPRCERCVTSFFDIPACTGCCSSGETLPCWLCSAAPGGSGKAQPLAQASTVASPH